MYIIFPASINCYQGKINYNNLICKQIYLTIQDKRLMKLNKMHLNSQL